MRRARARELAGSACAWALVLLAVRSAHAEPDPCSSKASVSPCFDADPLWLPTGPTPFVGVRSPRALETGALAFVLGVGVSHRPVVVVTPSPHPEGQEIDLVNATSTLTLGGRIGLGQGLDVGLAVPVVPYQTGAGTGSITTQRSDPLTSVTLRDPRVELGAELFGRKPRDPFGLGTHLELGVPLGGASALAGAAGPTVAPGVSAALRLDPLNVGLDLGVRFVRAVSLGTVREGSSFTAGLGVAVTLLHEPELALGVEASLRPSLASRPAGAPSNTLDLPAEWLASARFDPSAGWSLLLGVGSGLPFSQVLEQDGSRADALAVTSPDFRGVALARYTLPPVF